MRRLADDIPALWQAPSTTAGDRQAIARLMLDRVVILVRGSTEHADIPCHWTGDVITQHTLIRPVRRFEQFDRLMARIADLRRDDATAQTSRIASTPKAGDRPRRRHSTRQWSAACCSGGALARNGPSGPRVYPAPTTTK